MKVRERESSELKHYSESQAVRTLVKYLHLLICQTLLFKATYSEFNVFILPVNRTHSHGIAPDMLCRLSYRLKNKPWKHHMCSTLTESEGMN